MLSQFDLRTIGLLFTVLFLAPLNADALEHRTNTASVGIETQYHTFKEAGDKESGFLYGANGAYTYRGKFITESLPKGMFRLEGNIIFGRAKFEGQQLDQFGNSSLMLSRMLKSLTVRFAV